MLILNMRVYIINFAMYLFIDPITNTLDKEKITAQEQFMGTPHFTNHISEFSPLTTVYRMQSVIFDLTSIFAPPPHHTSLIFSVSNLLLKSRKIAMTQFFHHEDAR